jgi:hypothetical protein
MRLVGKRVGQGLAASTADGPGNLFYITDNLSGTQFLIDTGSTYSLIPHTSTASSFGPTLRAADRRRISCWGFVKQQIQLGERLFSWRFLRAQVKIAILGIDFLKHFSLVIDPSMPCLLPRTLPPTASSCFAVTAANSAPRAAQPAAVNGKATAATTRQPATPSSPHHLSRTQLGGRCRRRGSFS